MLTRLEGAHAFYVSIFGVVEHLRADKGTRLRLSGVVRRTECHLRRRIYARGQRVGGGQNSIMPESTDKVVIPESTYDVIELIGYQHRELGRRRQEGDRTGRRTLRELRVAEVVDKHMVIHDGNVELYRTKVKVSFKYEGHG